MNKYIHFIQWQSKQLHERYVWIYCDVLEVEGQLNEMKSDSEKKREGPASEIREGATGEGARQRLLERWKARNIHTEGFFYCVFSPSEN